VSLAEAGDLQVHPAMIGGKAVNMMIRQTSELFEQETNARQQRRATAGALLRMPARILLAPLLAACTCLTGCGTILDAITDQKADGSVSAVGIDSVKDNLPPPALTASRQEKLEYLGNVVTDSEQKCQTFLNGLVLGENTVNTSADIAATVFSALSTAFVPPGTKTALSAAATIASGSKTAIDADIYDKAAISDFSTAIQKTYSVKIQEYTTGLPNLTDTTTAPLILSNEVAKIKAIHALCGLAPAESSLQAKLATTETAPSSTTPSSTTAASQSANGSAPPSGHARPSGAPHPLIGTLPDAGAAKGQAGATTQAPVWGDAW
jgi:hypothetical protein